MHDERLDVESLHLWRGDRHVLRGGWFLLAGGECLQVAGPHGSGQTSLLPALFGVLYPEEGPVLVVGEAGGHRWGGGESAERGGGGGWWRAPGNNDCPAGVRDRRRGERAAGALRVLPPRAWRCRRPRLPGRRGRGAGRLRCSRRPAWPW